MTFLDCPAYLDHDSQARCGLPICANGYRVLTWDGRIADGFAWTDPADDRRPAEVLRGEGVRFIDGKADPDQRLPAEDLLALAEELA
jgi:hypothetical protein